MRRLASGAIKLLFSFGFVQDVLELPAFPGRPLLGSDAGIERLDDETLSLRGIVQVIDATAQDAVDGLLPRLAGAAVFTLELDGEVVVDGEGGAHIMMFAAEAS